MTKNQPFKIVAVGEDFAAVMLAQELSRRLAAGVKPGVEISSDAWKFEALENLQTGKQAAKGAARADMVIIAASGAEEPPAHVKGWIESWLPRKQKSPTALVALLDDEGETPFKSSALCSYLRRIACEWGMDFFSNSGEWFQQHFASKAGVPRRQRKSQRREADKGTAGTTFEATAHPMNEAAQDAARLHVTTGHQQFASATIYQV